MLITSDPIPNHRTTHFAHFDETWYIRYMDYGKSISKKKNKVQILTTREGGTMKPEEAQKDRSEL